MSADLIKRLRDALAECSGDYNYAEQFEIARALIAEADAWLASGGKQVDTHPAPQESGSLPPSGTMTVEDVDRMSLNDTRFRLLFDSHDNLNTHNAVAELLGDLGALSLEEACERIDTIIQRDMDEEHLMKPDEQGIWPAISAPNEAGWYECWATDDRWGGKMTYRAWNNGVWWTPLRDGWISAPRGIYRWRGPVADINGPAPDGTNPVPAPPKEGGKS